MAALVLTLENAGLAMPADYQSVARTLLATRRPDPHALQQIPAWFTELKIKNEELKI